MRETHPWRPLAAAVAALAAGCSPTSTSSPAPAYAWATVASPTAQPLNAVAFANGTHAWAVGHQSTILFFDGTSWIVHPQSGIVPGTALWDVCAKGSLAWAVGWDATILFFDGTGWSVVNNLPGSSAELYSCVVLDPRSVGDRRVLVGGVGGRYALVDGNAVVDWYQLSEPYAIRGWWALSPDHVWVAGDATRWGAVLRRDLDAWSTHMTTETIQGVGGTGPSGVWAVGSSGTILHFDGNLWTPQESGTTSLLRHLAVLDATHAWAVGDPTASVSTLLFFDGSGWTLQPTGTDVHLLGIATWDGSSVFAVGDGGTILRGTPTR